VSVDMDKLRQVYGDGTFNLTPAYRAIAFALSDLIRAAADELDELQKGRATALSALGGLPEFSLVEQCQKRAAQLNDVRAHVAALEDDAMGNTVYLMQVEKRLAESESAHEATKRELEELRKRLEFIGAALRPGSTLDRYELDDPGGAGRGGESERRGEVNEGFPCRHCGTTIKLHSIYPRELDDRTHDDARCMSLVKAQRDDARAEVARLKPKPAEFCGNCPFAKHVHWEEDGKLVAPGCSGYVPQAKSGA
jgi:hypothetical protein